MEYVQKHESEFTVLFATLAFFLPFILSHPQWLMGTSVNALLALGAFSLPWKRIIPIILLPSVGALLSGLVFGPMSFFLIYMIPFIWAGNALFVYALKSFGNRQAYHAVILKVSVILSGALMLFFAGLVPGMFLIAMGPLQIATAIAGLVTALGIMKLSDRKWAPVLD